MPEQKLDWTPPADTEGWCAVVLPDQDAFQGYYIRRNEETRKNALLLSMGALSEPIARNAHSLGALQAVLVEGAMTHRSELVGGAALALMDITKHPYYAIIAHVETAGTRTEQVPLEASSVEEARAALDRLPSVVAIKERIAAKAPKEKH